MQFVMPAHIIDGRKYRAIGNHVTSPNPYSGDVLWSPDEADDRLINEAVSAARRSFDYWSKHPVEGRLKSPELHHDRSTRQGVPLPPLWLWNLESRYSSRQSSAWHNVDQMFVLNQIFCPNTECRVARSLFALLFWKLPVNATTRIRVRECRRDCGGWIQTLT
jgi:hypothetical protein